MKKLSVLFTLLLLLGTVSAQEFDVPKTGAKIYLTNNSIEWSGDKELTFDLWIVRSKRAKKEEFLAPKFLGSKDLDFEVVADPENRDHYRVRLKSSNVASGEYFYTVTSRSKGIHKVTGTTASVRILPTKQVVASDDN